MNIYIYIYTHTHTHTRTHTQVYVTPLSLLGVLPTVYIYWSIFSFFRRTSREVKRIEANIRSPVYAHLTESLAGVASLRALALVAQVTTDP